ncbi:MAG TPA: hypothetical protein VJ583_06465 [Nitrososphaeraceae archaeon]|nr:hypothetical protein [Nitrososphaeraceae archaeon]
MTSDFTEFNFIDIVNKEARGFYETCDLGETKDISGKYIVSQKWTRADNDRFYIPKNLVDYFDSTTVYFKITEEEAKQYKRLNHLKFFSIILGLVNSLTSILKKCHNLLSSWNKPV